jgi:hypothetical protein
MTTPKDNAVEAAPGSRVIYPSSLAPGERHAPVADLSLSKRSALVACFKAGGLNKKDGAWHGAPGGTPVSGITTADLARDGMLTVTPNKRNGSAADDATEENPSHIRRNGLVRTDVNV